MATDGTRVVTCSTWQTNGQGNTAVTLDLQNNVWSAGYNIASVFKLSPTGVVLGVFPVGGGQPHGLSVDFQGFIWSVNDANATITKLNPDGTAVGTYTLGGPTNDNYTPYLYSDFTGVQVNRQAPYARFGNWSGTYDGVFPGIPWAKVATRVLLGQDLYQALRPYAKDRHQAPVYYAKASAFCFYRFPGPPPALGPEMRSTGETMGIGRGPEEALAKARLSAGQEKLGRLGRLYCLQDL